ncbi:MAG: hypothetical protein ACI87W_000780 [Halieaceae bacterium]|jgi:hypothetical protein
MPIPTLAPVDLSLTYEETLDVGNPQLGDGVIVEIGQGTAIGTVIGQVGEIDGEPVDFGDTYLLRSSTEALSVISITLESDIAGFGQVGGSVYTADGRYIANITALGSLFPSSFVAGIDEAYYVEVYSLASDGAAPYTLSIDIQDAGIDDVLFGFSFETDLPDDIQNVVPQFAFGSGDSQFGEVTGTVGSANDSADYFAIQSATDSIAVLSIEVRGGNANAVIILEDGSSEIIPISAVGGSGSADIEVPVITNGVYYFGIEPVGENAFDYSWDVRFPGPDDGPLDYVEGVNIFDAPDTPTEAPWVGVTGIPSLISGSITDGDSGDVYAFSADDADSVAIELRAYGTQVYGVIYDSSNGFVDVLWPLEDASFGAGFLEVTPGETYYLEVSGTTSTDAYEVELVTGAAHVAPAGTTDEVRLPGGQLLWSEDVGGTLGTSTLTPLDGNGNLAALGSLGRIDPDGNVDPADVYRFVASVNGSAMITVLSDTGAAGTITLFDTTGEAIASDADSDGNGIFSTELIAGEVYALEIPWTGEVPGTYSLSLDAPAPAAFPERSAGILLGDAGGSSGIALTPTLSAAGDAVIRGSVGIGSDKLDVYLVQPTVSGELSLFLGDDFQTGLALSLYDVTEDSTLEATPDSLFFSGPGQLYGARLSGATVTAGREYLITVAPGAPAPVPALYTLTINAPTALMPVLGDDLVDGTSIGDAPSDDEFSYPLEFDFDSGVTVTGSLEGFNFSGVSDAGDSFSFTALADATLLISLLDIVPETTARLYLTTSVDDGMGGQTFAGGSSGQGGDDVIRPLMLDVQAGETYFVDVFTLGGASSYSLDIRSRDAAAEGPETTAPNNPVLAPLDLTQTYVEDADVGTADPYGGLLATIGPGTGFGRATGAIGQIDELTFDSSDTFLFTSPDDALSIVSIELASSNPDLNGFLWGSVYAADGRYITDLADPASGLPTLLYAGIGESYFVNIVYTGGGEPIPYSLSVDFTDAHTGDTALATDELGDTPDDAESVVALITSDSGPSNFAERTGNVGSTDDTADYFGFQSTTDGTALLSLETRGDNAAVTVIHENGSSEIVPIPLGVSGGSAAFEIPVFSGGIYYLGIESTGLNSVDYSWDLRLPGQDDGPQDMVNGQNVFDAPSTVVEASAVDISEAPAMLTGSLGGGGDGSDVYSFVAGATGAVAIEILSENGPLRGEVFDSNDNTVSYTVAANIDTFYGGAFLNLQPDATYFLRVFPLLASTKPEYSVEISSEAAHQAPPGTLDEANLADGSVLWSGDAGDTLGRSTLTPLDSNGDLTVSGSLGNMDNAQTSDTADVYRFVATASGAANISLKQSGAQTIGALTLSDAAGAIIATATPSEGLATLNTDLSIGEVYTVGVDGIPGGAGDYTLLIDAAAPTTFSEERLGYKLLGDAGNSAETALDVPLSAAGDAVIAGRVGFDDDVVDVFRVVPTASGVMSLLLEDDYQASLDLIVVDVTDASTLPSSRLDAANNRWTGQATTDIPVIAGREYVITVKPAVPIPAAYTLTVNAPSGLTSAGQEEQVNGVAAGDAPNPFSEGPMPIELTFAGDARIVGSVKGFGQDQNGGFSQDQDSFSFTAPAAGELRLTLLDTANSDDSGGENSARVALYSQDAQGMLTFVGSGIYPSSPSDAIEPLVFDVVGGNDYAFRVYSFAETPVDYTVEIDAPAGIVDFVPLDRFEDGILYDADFLLDTGEFIRAEDAQLFRTYGGALGRVPDVGGFDWWSEQISLGNHDLDSMVAGFIFSTEFLGFFDGVTHPIDISSADFVSHMYENVFGRAPDEEGFNFWTGELDSGARSQQRVVVDMTQSNEFIELTANGMTDFLI